MTPDPAPYREVRYTTEHWLARWGFQQAPYFCTREEKVSMIEGACLSWKGSIWFVDDDPSVAKKVTALRPESLNGPTAFMPIRPWTVNEFGGKSGVKRRYIVEEIEELL